MSFEQAVVNLEQTNAKLQEEVVRFRDAAMGLNSIYASVTEGRQAVGDGKYFSVPGSGSYMRLYRRQGSSAQLIAEFPDRDELNSVIAQLGPLLGRGVVGGSGDLMAEGYNGWGGAISYGANSDFHTLPYGAAGNEGQSSIPANAPLSGNNRYAGLKLGNTNAELLLLAATLTPGRPIFAAVKSAAGWEGYRRMLSDRDILGAVSQFNGVPTGAVIERGSNANGTYVKLFDGTLLLFFPRESVPVTTAEGMGFTSSEVPKAYPYQPVSLISNNGVASSVSASGCFLTHKVGSSSVIFAVKSFINVSNTFFDAVLIGRWY